MKKKSPKNIDVAETMVQIQAQLAALDTKLEAFINKSLSDIAQALASQKVAVAPRPVQPPSAPIRSHEQSRRPMFAVVCFECGKDTQIPFKPSQGRPVYCPECFAKRKANKVSHYSTPPAAPAAAIKIPEPSVKEKKKVPAAKKSVTKQKATAKKKSK